MNVESFNLDHTKVKAPYIRLVGVIHGEHGDNIYKYDIRFCQPNKGAMEMPALHSLEHLLAEWMRNHLLNIIDISPMGCQTGFYLTVLNQSNINEIYTALEKTLQDILAATEVPASNEIQCGNAKSHSLIGAQKYAKYMLDHKDEWSEVFFS